MTDSVEIPVLLQDPEYLRAMLDDSLHEEIPLVVHASYETVEEEGGQFDGPVSARVAILDFDPDTGQLRPGARFRPRRGRRKATYEYDESVVDPDIVLDDGTSPQQKLLKLQTDTFVQLNTYGWVMRTTNLFEREDMLGRRITWAFPSEQLLVVPRAGVAKNAFYDRDSGSLNFFFYPSQRRGTVHACLSSDIIAHETTHAILDGISPGLYDASSTQSLALHEAIADLVAIGLGVLDGSIVYSLHNLRGPGVDAFDVLAKLGEEFGSDLRRASGTDFIRAMNSNRTLDSSNRTCDELGTPDYVGDRGPHGMSEVMSGAVYSVLRAASRSHHVRSRKPYDTETASEKQTLWAGKRVMGMVIHALDYLPPGEASFADYGRAVMAADRACYSCSRREAVWLAEELVSRGVVSHTRELTEPHERVGERLTDLSPAKLTGVPSAAESFVEAHRDLLGLDRSTPFRIESVRSRIRKPARSKTEDPDRDVIIRVAWDAVEQHDVGKPFGRDWAVAVGTTLVIDEKSAEILSLLRSDSGEPCRADRDATLKRWAGAGLLKPEEAEIGPFGRKRKSALFAHKVGGAMRVAGCGRVLHILGDAP
jgi:hypothetical protein